MGLKKRAQRSTEPGRCHGPIKPNKFEYLQFSNLCSRICITCHLHATSLILRAAFYTLTTDQLDLIQSDFEPRCVDVELWVLAVKHNVVLTLRSLKCVSHVYCFAVKSLTFLFLVVFFKLPAEDAKNIT